MFSILYKTPNGRELKMPNLTAKSFEYFTKALNQANILFEVEEVKPARQEPIQKLAQEPVQNSKQTAYEIILRDKTDVRSKLYADREKFKKDYLRMEKTTTPFKAQGIGKDGKPFSLKKNGWDDSTVILTAVVKFPNNRKYKYSAEKRYSGMYEVETEYGESVVSVNYEYRDRTAFYAELNARGYDEPVPFEDILIRKIKQ